MFKNLMWRLFGWHDWEYNGPYARRCKVCDRHEGAQLSSGMIYWEVLWQGDETLHDK